MKDHLSCSHRAETAKNQVRGSSLGHTSHTGENASRHQEKAQPCPRPPGGVALPVGGFCLGKLIGKNQLLSHEATWFVEMCVSGPGKPVQEPGLDKVASLGWWSERWGRGGSLWGRL